MAENKQKHIRCAICEYAQIDRNACVYTKKRCRTCEVRETCEICRDCDKRETCKARTNPNAKQGCERRSDKVCSKQEITWTAIQCTNSDSEYNRALLNVSPGGEMQERITWSGCPHGETRPSGARRWSR